MLFELLLAAFLLLRPTLAVFADEAWNLDYHYALLGEPKQDTTFFHQPNPDSKASLIYTLSEKAVLGAVNPRDGAIVWRQVLAHSAAPSNTSFLRASEGQDIIISGLGNQVAAWSAADGRLVWSQDVNVPLADVEILELEDGRATPGAKDAVTLSGGEHGAVRRLDGASGAVKWEYKLDSGDIPYQVSASTTQVFAILLHKTMLGYLKIKVVSLDPVTGHKTDEYTLSSESELATADTIISVGANSASPIIAWTDAAYTVLKINVIGNKAVSSFNIEKDGETSVGSIQIHAPYRTNSLAHFLAHYATATSHWAEVFHVDVKKSKVEKAYSLPKIGGQGAFATSTLDANVYFTRVTSSEILTVSSASHGILGRWPINGFGVVAGADEEVEPVRAVCELSIRGSAISAIRTAILLSTGDWVLLREGSLVWNRPEALASTTSATFAVSAQVEDLAQDLAKEASSNIISAYVHRVARHVLALQRLPELLLSLPQRLISGFFGTDADGDASSDAFGFHKIVVCATQNGRLIAIDAGSPNTILWTRETGLSTLAHASLQSPSEGVVSVATGPGVDALLFNASTGALVSGGVPSYPAKVTEDIHPLPDVRVVLQDGKLDARLSNQAQSELWNFEPAAGERIISLVSRPVNDPVASIGKVLGDRRVLYKYLDPNLALVLTANDATNTLSSYILDTVSGAIIHSSIYSSVDLTDPISSTMSENWFTFSFTAEASESSPKGHYLVVGEMLESLIPNDRGALQAATNFSSMASSVEPFTLVQTYQISEGISKMSVTQTRQGITSRDLLAILEESNAIISIPYAVLDPRRPVNRDPTTQEQMEGLFRYTPVIEFDPKWFLSHQREVVGVENIITTPALIESTSIVFAYGLDIFGTRLSPSFSFDILGKDFNKFQMLATVAALAVATFVVAPLVMRKQINLRWQFT